MNRSNFEEFVEDVRAYILEDYPKPRISELVEFWENGDTPQETALKWMQYVNEAR